MENKTEEAMDSQNCINQPPRSYLEIRISRIPLEMTILRQRFYVVSREQLDVLSGISWFTNLFFMFAGVTSGGLITCWVGKQQPNLPIELAAKINTAFTFFVILTILLLFIAGFYAYRQWNARNRILESERQNKE